MPPKYKTRADLLNDNQLLLEKLKQIYDLLSPLVGIDAIGLNNTIALPSVQHQKNSKLRLLKPSVEIDSIQHRIKATPKVPLIQQNENQQMSQDQKNQRNNRSGKKIQNAQDSFILKYMRSHRERLTDRLANSEERQRIDDVLNDDVDMPKSRPKRIVGVPYHIELRNSLLEGKFNGGRATRNTKYSVNNQKNKLALPKLYKK